MKGMLSSDELKKGVNSWKCVINGVTVADVETPNS
jgi:hypothetical protein